MARKRNYYTGSTTGIGGTRSRKPRPSPGAAAGAALGAGVGAVARKPGGRGVVPPSYVPQNAAAIAAAPTMGTPTQVAARNARERVPRKPVPATINLESPFGSTLPSVKVAKPKAPRARRVTRGVNILQGRTLVSPPALTSRRRTERIVARETAGQQAAAEARETRGKLAKAAAEGPSAGFYARELAQEPTPGEAAKAARRRLTKGFRQLREANPNTYRKLTTPQRVGIVRSAPTVFGRERRQYRNLPTKYRAEDVKIPDTPGPGVPDWAIQSGIATAKSRQVGRAARSITVRRAAQVFDNGVTPASLPEGYAEMPYRKAAERAYRKGDRKALKAIREALQQETSKEVLAELEMAIRSESDSIEAGPEGGRPVGPVKIAGAEIAGVSDVLAAAANAPSDAAAIAAGFFPGLARIVSHPTQLPQLIDEAFDQSFVGRLVAGDLQGARAYAREMPVSTVLEGAGYAAGAGFAATGLGRAGLLGSRLGAAAGRAGQRRPVLTTRMLDEATDTARGFELPSGQAVGAPRYSYSLWRNLRQRGSEKRLHTQNITNRERAEMVERAEQGGQMVMERGALGRKRPVDPTKEAGRFAFYIPGLRVAVRNPFYTVREAGGEAARLVEPPDVIDVSSGSTAFSRAVLTRGAIREGSTAERMMRLRANMEVSRYDAAVRPSFFAKLFTRGEDVAKYRLPDPQVADMVPYAVVGVIRHGENLVPQLQRHLDDLKAALKNEDAINKDPGLRKLNLEAQEHVGRLIDYAATHQDLADPKNNLWNAAKLYAKGDEALGIRGQGGRDAAFVGLGLVDEEQAIRAVLGQAAAVQGKAVYSTDRVPSPARRAAMRTASTIREMEKELKRAQRAYGKAKVRFAREESRAVTTRRHRPRPPRTEEQGRGRGRPLQQSMRHYEAEEELKAAERRFKKAGRDLERAKSESRQGVGYRAKTRIERERERQLLLTPQYRGWKDEVKELNEKINKLERESDRLERKAPEIEAKALERRRGKPYKNQARAVQTKLGLIRGELMALRGRRGKVHRNMREYRRMYSDAGIFEQALREMFEGRIRMEAGTKEIGDVATEYSRYRQMGGNMDQMHVDDIARELEKPELTPQMRAELQRQYTDAVSRMGRLRGGQMALPALVNATERLMNRVAKLHALREWARDEKVKDLDLHEEVEAGRTPVWEASGEGGEWEIVDLSGKQNPQGPFESRARAEEAADAGNSHLGHRSNRIIAAIDETLAEDMERITQFRGFIARRTAHMGDRIGNLVTGRVRAIGELAYLRERLRNPHLTEPQKMQIRDEVLKAEERLKDVEDDIAEWRIRSGMDYAEEIQFPIHEPGATDEVLQYRERLVEKYNEEGMGALFEEASEAGVPVRGDMEFDEIIDRLIEYNLAGTSLALPGPMRLPVAGELRNLYFPDKAKRDLDILIRTQGDEVEAEAIYDAAREAVENGEIELKHLRATSNKLTPQQTLVFARARAKAMETKRTKEWVESELKKERRRLAEAKKAITAEKAAGRPAWAYKGWVDPETGAELTTAQLRELAGREQEQLAFLSLTPPDRSGIQYTPYAPGTRPTKPNKPRTGTAISRGLTGPLTLSHLYQHMTRQERGISVTESIDRLMGQASVGAYQTRDAAAAAGRRMVALQPGLAEMVPVQLGPMWNVKRAEAQAINKLTGERDLNEAEMGALKEMFSAMEQGTEGGLWTNVPRPVWDLMKDSANRHGGIFSFMQALTQSFKLNVLPFSLRWHTGNLADMLLRSAADNLHPGHWSFGAQVFKSIEDQFGPRMADMVRMSTLGTGFFGPRSIMDVAPRRGYGGLGDVGRKLHDDVQLVGSMWDYYDRARSGSFRFADFYETHPRYAALGKRLKRDVDHFTAKWGKAMKTEQELIDKMATELVSDARLRDRYFAEINDVIGDYVTRSPKFKDAVTTLMPFGLWIRNALKFTFWTMPRNHPIKTALGVAISKLSQEDQEKWDTKPWMRGAIPVGGSYLTTQQATSLGAAQDPLSFAGESFSLGLMGAPIQGALGRDPFGNPLDRFGNAPLSFWDRFGIAMRNFYEGLLPLSRYARILREKGGVAEPTSNVFSPKIVPGTELPLAERFRRIGDITYSRSQPEGGSGESPWELNPEPEQGAPEDVSPWELQDSPSGERRKRGGPLLAAMSSLGLPPIDHNPFGFAPPDGEAYLPPPPDPAFSIFPGSRPRNPPDANRLDWPYSRPQLRYRYGRPATRA